MKPFPMTVERWVCLRHTTHEQYVAAAYKAVKGVEVKYGR